MIIYTVAAVILIAAVPLTMYALADHHSPHKGPVYPLGSKDLVFDRDVGVGTVFVMNASGKVTVETYDDEVLQSTEVIDVTGTRTVQVTEADASTYTYKETVRLSEKGVETVRVSTYKVDRTTGEIIENPDVSVLNSNNVPKADTYEKWGSHELGVDNWKVVSEGITYSMFVFSGVDDRVCYQINESFEVGSKAHGNIGSYSIEYLLDSMDFKKF